MKKLQKRLLGMNFLMFLLIFSASKYPVQKVTTCIDVQMVENNHLRNAMSEKTVPAKKKASKKIFLKNRYNDIKLYGENDFLKKFIENYSPIIKKVCKERNINASMSTAMIITENVVPSNKSYGLLAEKCHNWFNLKVKSGAFYSDSFKAYIKLNSTGTISKFDDCEDVNGKRIKCEFYKFKTDDAGIEAGIRFIADRINSDLINYQGKFNHPVSETEKWVYDIYDSGYANKNVAYPYDKKLMRNIIQYNLDKLYGYE